jgi:hypothetical protein
MWVSHFLDAFTGECILIKQICITCANSVHNKTRRLTSSARTSKSVVQCTLFGVNGNGNWSVLIAVGMKVYNNYTYYICISKQILDSFLCNLAYVAPR